MRLRFLSIVILLFISSVAFAQDDAEVKGNTVTTKQTSPVWPGCEKSDDPGDCFNKKFMQHVKENYKYPKNDAGEYVRGKATIKMIVNKEGIVEVQSIKAKNNQVKQAAKDMIEKMPKMKPGMLVGKPTDTKFTIPLNL